MFPVKTNTDPLKTPSGEIVGNSNILIARTAFENALLFGRFAKYDTGRVDNMDGSATPVIAGIVVRDMTNPIDDGLAYTTENTRQIDLVAHGLATVEAIAGETPSFNAPIYARNSGAGDMGKASVASANGILTDARFVEKITDTVWLVFVTGQAPTAVTVNNLNFMTPDAYTVATVPDATENEGLVIFVSDGAGGEPVLARSNGTIWEALDGSGAEISDGEE